MGRRRCVRTVWTLTSRTSTSPSWTPVTLTASTVSASYSGATISQRTHHRPPSTTVQQMSSLRWGFFIKIRLYCATDAFYQLQAAINIHQKNTICIYVSHMFLNEKTFINKIHQWTDWDLMPLVHLKVHAKCVRSAHAKLNAQTSACRRKESPSLTNSNPDCFRFKDNPHRWQSEALILTVKFSNPICQLAPRSQQQWFSNNIILWIFQKLIYA